MADPNRTNPIELSFHHQLEQYFLTSKENLIEKLKNFPKYVPRQDITRFLVRYELFKKVLYLHGSIIEAGVLHGGGLMAFAHFSSIFEHLNHERKIIGFDTYEGFPQDASEFDNKEYAKKGALAVDSYDDLKESVRLYDLNRFLNFNPKVELVKGDICKTVPQYVKDNSHLIVSLLFIDVDMYEPTKVILEHLVPRMPKGAILAFDNLNDQNWPGETMALLNTIGIRNLQLERFSFDTRISYAVLQ